MILPFLLLLLSGLVDFGRLYNAQITLSHAAREGVRVWSLEKDATATENRVRAASVGLENPDSSAHEVTVDPLPGGCEFGQKAEINIRYELRLITPIGPLLALIPGGSDGLGDSIPLSAKGVMRCGG